MLNLLMSKTKSFVVSEKQGLDLKVFCLENECNNFQEIIESIGFVRRVVEFKGSTEAFGIWNLNGFQISYHGEKKWSLSY